MQKKGLKRLHVHLRHAGLSGIISFFCNGECTVFQFYFRDSGVCVTETAIKNIILFVKTIQEVKGLHQVGVPESQCARPRIW